MARPTLITVQGTYLRPDGTPDSGSVTFASLTFARHNASDDVMAPGALTAELSESGDVTLDVPATDDPAWSPVDWTYRVTVQLSGVRMQFAAAIPYDAPGGVLDLSELLPAQPADGELYAAYSHTHPDLATDVELASAISTALAPYATDAEVADAVADYLPLSGGTVTGSVVVQDATASKNYGLRTSGGSLDFDAAGADLYLSTWSGAGNTGTQRTYMRLESGAQLAHATGRWLVADGPFSGTGVADLDPSTGVAGLGTKNGATNLRIAGYLDIAGAPTTGAWALGDVVMTATGVYRCIAAGTPGTWTSHPTGFQAVDAGYGAWSYDPAQTQAGTILPTAGLSFIARMRIFTSTISAINLHLTVAGSGLTNAFATVHNDAGVKIGAGAVTANQNTNLQTGGERTMPLSVAQSVTPGDFYKIRFWVTGTTLPTLSRQCNSSTAIVNAGLSAPNFRWSTADSGLTDAASAPDTIGTMTGGGTAWWVAVKP